MPALDFHDLVFAVAIERSPLDAAAVGIASTPVELHGGALMSDEQLAA